MNKEHYDRLVAAVEQELRKHYIGKRWRVARYDDLVRRGEITETGPLPTCLLVDARSRYQPGRTELRVSPEMIAHSPNIHSLVHAIGRQVDKALAYERFQVQRVMLPPQMRKSIWMELRKRFGP